MKKNRIVALLCAFVVLTVLWGCGQKQRVVDVAMEGGTGRASIESPAVLDQSGNQDMATIVWSSPNYDYMIVDGERYLPTNTDGNSTFQIPVLVYDEPFAVIADTTAMSTPHEIEYTLTFDSSSIR